MNGVWEECYTVRTYDVDMHNTIKADVLFRYFQEIAFIHAHHLELGYEHLIRQNLVWLLSRFKILIHEYPVCHSKMLIRTWPVSVESIYALRNFEIICDGKTVCEARSYWIMVDTKRMRPVRPELLSKRKELFVDKPVAISEVNKIKIADKELHEEYVKDVRYSDIDQIGHVNNARYVEWILDAFDEKFYKDHTISEFQIDFVKEALFGDKVRIMKGDFDDNRVIVSAINGKTSNPFCNAEIKYI